ncbi:protoheme IX farnesyltransferase [Gaeumannomyces tritici R3-111a-1]|uniref:Protoheme IX farnesyltransferase, mitochondrial n=1 Tax=Gaeumannomyces tritici (strain R3-111a-1) TaxID=644352 RepID=J3P8I4_GAET3|nr:protoheme IX farnesyltransferase [Gaeumannomyces tritici R3-111a-1]EJT72967.1 protoheme IX farnesyltransferase [Gaeumannomyces tritici R3-111a-1]
MPGPRPLLPGVGALDNVCWRCCRRRLPARQRFLAPLSTTARPRSAAGGGAPSAPAQSPRVKGAYFLSNTLLDRFGGIQFRPRARNMGAAAVTSRPPAKPASNTFSSSPYPRGADEPPPSAASTTTHDVLPHRRRQAAKRAADPSTSATSGPDKPSSSSSPADAPLPPDASSILAEAAAKQPADSLRRKLSALLSLSKPRLTFLVVLSAMAPYALYPVPAFLSPGAAEATLPSLSPLTLLFLTTGTTLCSAAANALNMLYEPRTDALMSRTRARPLVRGLVSTRAAVLFAVGCAVAGVAALHLGVNPTVAFLGAANIALYAGVYTPMKRLSAANTWVGAVVGGIPPLMGWAAAAGESAVGDGSWRELLLAPDGSSAGGWLFAALLFAWQFPHFMALSWGVRDEYRTAGLRMLAWTNPARNARVALRYGLLGFLPICVGLCAVGVTDWSFAVTSLPVNVWLARESVRFWRLRGAGGSARGLFWASVWHLPVVMVLALLQKKGMWGRVWRSLTGEGELVGDDDDEGWEYVEDDDGGGAK